MLNRKGIRKPFRALGMRMRNFGRGLIRNYVTSQNITPAPELPPSWQDSADQPLVWRKEDDPAAIDETMPPEDSTTSPIGEPITPSKPRSAPAVRRRPRQPATDDEGWKPPAHLLKALERHQEREATRARLREKRGPERSSASPEVQRRRRASFDYVETSSLSRIDKTPEVAQTTPDPMAPAEPVQREIDHPEGDDHPPQIAPRGSPDASTPSDDSLISGESVEMMQRQPEWTPAADSNTFIEHTESREDFDTSIPELTQEYEDVPVVSQLPSFERVKRAVESPEAVADIQDIELGVDETLEEEPSLLGFDPGRDDALPDFSSPDPNQRMPLTPPAFEETSVEQTGDSIDTDPTPQQLFLQREIDDALPDDDGVTMEVQLPDQWPDDMPYWSPGESSPAESLQREVDSPDRQEVIDWEDDGSDDPSGTWEPGDYDVEPAIPGDRVGQDEFLEEPIETSGEAWERESDTFEPVTPMETIQRDAYAGTEPDTLETSWDQESDDAGVVIPGDRLQQVAFSEEPIETPGEAWERESDTFEPVTPMEVIQRDAFAETEPDTLETSWELESDVTEAVIPGDRIQQTVFPNAEAGTHQEDVSESAVPVDDGQQTEFSYGEPDTLKAVWEPGDYDGESAVPADDDGQGVGFPYVEPDVREETWEPDVYDGEVPIPAEHPDSEPDTTEDSEWDSGGASVDILQREPDNYVEIDYAAANVSDDANWDSELRGHEEWESYDDSQPSEQAHPALIDSTLPEAERLSSSYGDTLVDLVQQSPDDSYAIDALDSDLRDFDQGELVSPDHLDEHSGLPLHALDLYEALIGDGITEFPPVDPASHETPDISRRSDDPDVESAVPLPGSPESDLLSLLNLPPDTPVAGLTTRTSEIAEKSPRSQPPPIDIPDSRPVIRPAVPPQPIRRQVESSSSTPADQSPADGTSVEDDVDVEQLARDVFRLLRERLRNERERR